MPLSPLVRYSVMKASMSGARAAPGSGVVARSSLRTVVAVSMGGLVERAPGVEPGTSDLEGRRSAG